MTRAVSRPAIVASCIDGVKRAQKSYHEWSDGLNVRTTTESFVQVEIARAIFKGDVPKSVERVS